MAKRNAYTTAQRARALRERHPDASPPIVATALVLASFADGPTGTMIRPGFDRVATLVGVGERTIQRHVKWLVERGELRRDKAAWRGSAACFSWIGGMHDIQVSPISSQSTTSAASKTTPDDVMHDTAMSLHQSHPSEDQKSAARSTQAAPNMTKSDAAPPRPRGVDNFTWNRYLDAGSPPCAWGSCSSVAHVENFGGWYCGDHAAATARGETP